MVQEEAQYLEYRATAGKRFRRLFGRDRVAIKTRDSTPKRITIGGSSMNDKNITGVRVYILTVDSETHTVLKTEEEDPKTGRRTELAPSFQAVPAQYPAPQTAIPVGFVPSIVILVGGQPVVGPTSIISTAPTTEWQPPTVTVPIRAPRGAPPPPEKAAEDEKMDKGGPPKV